MKELKFIQLDKTDEKMCTRFEQFMRQYMAELEEHDEHPLPEDILDKWIKSIIAMQGLADRHLEFCFDKDGLAGFLYGKIDHPEHKGFIKPGYGYIMEFYVLPHCRRRGYGRDMFLRLEGLFREHGAARMYLTTEPGGGKAFWEAMGFRGVGEVSPENGMEIYEKDVG